MIILASNSKRRKEILLNRGFDFKIVKSDFVELKSNLPPKKLALYNALGKAKDVFNKVDKQDTVLSADTVVYYKGKIFGKPKDEKEAEEFLSVLSNKTHKVITGFAVIKNGKLKKGYAVTKVRFNKLSKELIKEYVSSKLPLDKAGAYGIQDGFNLVKSYKGSYLNVVGLPIEKIEKLLK